MPFLSLAKNLLRKFESVFTRKISCLKTNLQSLQFVCFFSFLLSRSVVLFTLLSSLFPRFCDKHFLCYFTFSSQECSLTKLLIISSVLAIPAHCDAPIPIQHDRLVVALMDSSHPSHSIMIIPSKEG